MSGSFEPSETRNPPISLAGLGTVFEWLQQHGVSSSRLASVLGIKTGHLRVLRHRAQGLYFNPPGETLDAVLTRPTQQMRKRLGVRPHEDALLESPKAEGRIEELESEIDTIWRTQATTGRFDEGLAALLPYDSMRGYPSSAVWLRFIARLRQHRAWFLVHSGMTTSAFEEAKAAIDLSHLAYKEREDRTDLRRLAESCLIASQACALAAAPQTSLKLLDLFAEASARIFDRLGSEYYRQRGTAYLQIAGPDDTPDLRRPFENAIVAMQEKNEHRSIGQLMMAGQRHLAILGTPDVDLSAAILAQVEKDFPPGSLERAMMLNWTAACALSTGSSDLHVYAHELLQESLAQSAGFGHQATQAYLLSITSEILERRYWKAWIHRALYENAFRTR